MTKLRKGERVRLKETRAGSSKHGTVVLVNPLHLEGRYAVAWDGGPTLPGYTADELESLESRS